MIILRCYIKINHRFYYFYSEETLFMIKNMLNKMLLVCLMAIPTGVFAQTNSVDPNTLPVNRYQLLDKTWDFVAMKCPDKSGSDDHYINHFLTLKLTASNVNNINYGTYVKVFLDVRDNPKETGTYTLTTDDVGNLVLTLTSKAAGVTAKYFVPMVETNHLTLIRKDDGEKCNITYAIAP